MRDPVLAAGLTLAVLFATAADTAASTPLGGELQEFDYPHARRAHTFDSQGQRVSMTYMDVRPPGEDTGRVAVLLHGKNFCGPTWEDTIDTLLAAGWRVVVPDQVGFCGSTQPRGYQFSFAQLAANTRGLLEMLDVERPVIIGHSMGGMLGIRYALQYPDAVERLVLVNPIGLEDWQAEGVPYATIDTLAAGERATTADTIRDYQRRVYYDGQWTPRFERWVAMLAGMYAGPDGALVAWNQAQASEMIFTQPVIHELPALRVPTLLMIGGTDRTAPGSNRAAPELAARLGDYPALGRRAAAAIPDAELVEFPRLGHSPQVEDPDTFHAALLGRLRDVPRRPGTFRPRSDVSGPTP